MLFYLNKTGLWYRTADSDEESDANRIDLINKWQAAR
jgi:hypothetical protein